MSNYIRRREFVAALGAAVAWPLASLAQPSTAPRIGILALGNLDPGLFFKEFREGLRELGYIEGQSIAFEFRSAAIPRNSLSSPQNWLRSRSTSSPRFRPRP